MVLLQGSTSLLHAVAVAGALWPAGVKSSPARTVLVSGSLPTRGLKAVPVEMDWHSGLSIYASPKFLQSVGDEYGWLGGVDHEGRLRCILPYTIIQKTVVRMVRFRVETIAVHGELELRERKAFLNSVVEHFRLLGADVIIPATTNTIFRTYPDGAEAVPYGTFVLDLTQTEDALWRQVHSKHRNKIRTAAKQGVRMLSGSEYLDTAYALVRDTFQRSRLPFMDQESFRRMVEALGDHVKVLVAEHEGRIQGCAVIPFSSYCAYYVYGGTAEAGVTGAMNFLQWEAIRYFRNLGVQRYDFVGVRINPEKGSKAEGLQMFKERFGGQLVKGYMWKYALRPFKAAAYSLGVRLLRGGDIVDVESRRLRAGKNLP
jgi:Acetyltransferase (GNAT) domain